MSSRSFSRKVRRLHRCHLGEEQGIMIVEVLIAVLVLVVGILGLIGAFDSSRKLDLLSERRTVSAHRAQLEVERLQAIPYAQLALISAPAHSSETKSPDYYVNYSSPVKCSTNCYAWDLANTGEEEPWSSPPKPKNAHRRSPPDAEWSRRRQSVAVAPRSRERANRPTAR